MHRERLGELKALVARIAADVGLEAAAPLRGELAALGSRLEDVRASLATLAGAAEGRARRHADLRRTRDFLSAVQEVRHSLLSTRNLHVLSPGTWRTGLLASWPPGYPH